MDAASSAFDTVGIDLAEVLRAIGFIAVVGVASHVLGRLLRAWVEQHLMSRSFGLNGAILIGRVVSILTYLLAIVIILGRIGVSSTGLLTFLGAFSLAFGLSLQDVFKNFFSGIFLLLERPFAVGDSIKVRDVEGEVQGIDVRTTLVKVDDGSLVMVPNSIVFTEVLSNRSRAGKRRIDLTVTGKGRTVGETERLIHSALESIPAVSKPIPAPIVASANQESSILRISLLVDDDQAAQHAVVDALMSSAEDASITVART